MLQNLLIKNYALIQSLEIQPSNRLNMITGETGAGKSIMLGAVGLLLGNRADKKALLNQENKCIIEAAFGIDDYHLQPFFEEEDLDYESTSIIRREISPSGKSRAFINDTPVTLDSLKKLSTHLVDVHSQHDNLLLAKNQFQLQLVDGYAQHNSLLEQYRNDFNTYKQSEKAYQELNTKAMTVSKEEDYLKFQLNELTNAQLTSGEKEQLEEEMLVLENAESIKSKIFEVLVLLDQSDSAINNQLNTANSIMNALTAFSDKYQPLAKRIENSYIDLKDLIGELEKELDEVEFNPERITEVQDRLNLIYKLEQKHQVKSVESLIEITEKLEEKVYTLDTIELELGKAQEIKNKAYQQLMQAGKALSKSRADQFAKIEESVKKLMGNLGMENARIAITSREVDPMSHGIDEINLLFSANKGIQPQPLRQVASGGEFSRLLFCLKFILARKTAMPTMIFDEIDTGISGEVAIKMAKMMKEMANHHQVIAISHLPQFAATGEAHYYVYKDNSDTKAISKIRQLNGDERIMEIAKMIGGESPSTIAFENARELMSVS